MSRRLVGTRMLSNERGGVSGGAGEVGPSYKQCGDVNRGDELEWSGPNFGCERLAIVLLHGRGSREEGLRSSFWKDECCCFGQTGVFLQAEMRVGGR
jgi:hypothetical protein